MSVSQRLKLALSMNCMNSSVPSRITEVITRSNALSCSTRAFWRSEFCRALRNAVSAEAAGRGRHWIDFGVLVRQQATGSGHGHEVHVLK